MAKRKLTRRQSWRIQKIQDERAERAGKRSDKAESKLQDTHLGNEEFGVVIAHYGVQIDVESKLTGDVVRCHVRANVPALVTGDRVVFHNGNPTGVVVAQEERDNILERPDHRGQLKLVAANINHMLLVVAPFPEAHANLIDRYLIAAETNDIEPVLLLNKTDLIDPEQHAKLIRMVDSYEQLGYRVVRASCVNEAGLDELTDFLKDHTTVFVGQSGVGKSSLINALMPGTDTRVGSLSESTQKGRHTTTTAKLFHFPSGGDLIDSPGIREFSLWHMQPEDVYGGFKEIRPYLGLCKFRDCRHDREPGCAVQAALESGKISANRWQSCQQIIQGLGQPK
jgi:ribosome biogenesis GTPase